MTLKRILIISHDASRTGAPILLLNLAKALNSHYKIEFLLKRGGVLYRDFQLIAPTTILDRRLSIFQRINYKLRRSFNPKLSNIEQRLNSINWENIDIVISNTITNGDIIEQIRSKYSGKFISYIHELQIAANFYSNKGLVNKVIANSDFFLVPSEAVKSFVLNEYKIDESKISILDYYIPENKTLPNNSFHDKKSFIVGGVGTTDWRKSPDIFLLVARKVFSIKPEADIMFLWQGGDTKNIENTRLVYDISKLNLDDKVKFLDSSQDVSLFYNRMSLFLLTSREDPYPLVVLEAAASAIPTICFKLAGGAPEFVSKSASGYSIDYLDIEAMANKIIFYYENKSQLNIEGVRAKEFLSKTHQNKEYIIKQFDAIIMSL